MRNSLSSSIILLDCLLAWMLSGSPLPLSLSLIIGLIHLVSQTFRLRIGFLYSLAITLSFGCLQGYLFLTEQAFVVFSDINAIFQAGMILHWLFWLTRDDLEEDRKPGDPIFWIGLTGSALVFGSACAAENIEYPAWLIHFIAILPVLLILWTELLHRRKIGWISSVAIAVLSLILGQASVASESGVRQLIAFLWQDNREDSLPDETNDRPVDSGSGTKNTDSRELALRADISFTHKIRFYAHIDDLRTFKDWIQKPIYLRTSTLAMFQNDSKMSPLRKGQWHYDSDDGSVDSSTRIAEGEGGDTFPYVMLIHRSDETQLPLLTGTRKVGLDSIYEFAEGWFQLSAPEDAEWLRYQAETVSEYSVFPEKNSSWVTSSIFPVPPESPYLALPKTLLGERIKTQTRLMLKDLPAEKHPQAIAGYLRGNCRYSLQYLNPESLPPMENFLFRERKGHCELFASATVLMLRSAGIPSRIAYGYTGGQADPKSRMVAFRDSDFHSWAEILLADGHTWAVFDTTPVSPDSARHAPIKSDLGKIDLDRYQDIGNGEYIPVGEGVFVGTVLDSILEWMSLHFFSLMVTLPALTLFLGLVRKWRKRRQKAAGFVVQADGLRPPELSAAVELTFVDAIFALGKVYGFEKKGGQTLAEFVNLLRSNGVGSADLFDAVKYTYSIRYAGKSRDSRTEKGFLRSIRKLISTAS